MTVTLTAVCAAAEPGPILQPDSTSHRRASSPKAALAAGTAFCALAGAAGLLYFESNGTTNYSDGFQWGLIAFTAADVGRHLICRRCLPNTALWTVPSTSQRC